MLLVVICTSCRRHKCQDGLPGVSFQGFQDSELSLIKVKQYEIGSGFNTLSKTFYIGSSIKTASADSLPYMGFGVERNTAYEVTILKSNVTYKVSELAMKSSHTSTYIGSEERPCVNAFSYKINSTTIKEAPKEMNFSSPTYGCYLVIVKDREY